MSPKPPHDSLRHGIHCALNFRGGWRTQEKPVALNAVNQQGRRQAVHDAPPVHGFAHAESMRGAGEDVFRQPVGVRVPYSNLTGRSAGSSGVHEDDLLNAGPAIHQREALAAVLHDFDAEVFDAGDLNAGVSTPSARRRRATRRPAASSPRSKLPQPIMRRDMMRRALSIPAPHAGGGNASRTKCTDRNCAPLAHTSR